MIIDDSLDADGNRIDYQTEYLIDGRKRVFYEPTIIGEILWFNEMDR